MDPNFEARETAERALARLLELRASLSPSIADVAAVASDVRGAIRFGICGEYAGSAPDHHNDRFSSVRHALDDQPTRR